VEVTDQFQQIAVGIDQQGLVPHLKQMTGPPRFKKVKKYKSFTLKQAGWKLLDGNRIWLNGRNYKFVLSRPINGTIKTVTVKRDNAGRLFVCLSVIEEVNLPVEVSTGKIGGFGRSVA
jgi:putative transposase